MSAGTLTLVNNSVSVIGTGTVFNTELAAGDFIVVTVGGIPYTLPVEKINNNTSLTLVSEYAGPSQAGAAWYAVPRVALNMITAGLVAQSTEALRGLNYDKRNWQSVFSESGNVTVTLPDGSQFTGPSWLRIRDTLNEIDIDAVQGLADQVREDTAQVDSDKQAAQSAAESASTDAAAARVASSGAQSAKNDAETAASAALSNALSSKSSAEDAKTAAAAAEQSAAAVQPENLLQNINNLDDLTDKQASRHNLDVFSKTEIADMLPGYLGQIDWQEMRTALEPGTAPRDGQEVPVAGIFADLYAKALAGKLPTCTEAEWQANPLNRGCYVLESSPGKMRLPDDNGVQPGSLKIPVHVGDGGDLTKNGKMGASALPNVKSSTIGYSILGLLTENSSPNSALQVKASDVTNYGGTKASGAYGSNLDLDLSRADKIYQDGVAEIRPNRLHGCWTVRYAAKATNGGSIDALALATAIAAGDASLLAKIIATNARLDYALISPAVNPTLGSRTLFENPFGNNTPVFCVAEVYQSTLSEWINTGQTYASSTSVWGLRAGYVEGRGIVLVVGNTGYNIGAANVGNFGSNATSTNYTTVSPVRIHVWKITA